MSKILVDTIDTRSGTSNITIGSSNASQITLKSGATLTNFPDNTPAFHATNNADQTFSLDTDTKVTFQVEVFDTDNAFASNKFTVPSGKGGKYVLFIDGAFQSNANYREVWIKIYKNGSQGDQGNQIEQRLRLTSNYFNSGSSQRLSASGTIDLSAGDYIEVYGYINGASGTPQFNNGTMNFSGYKLI